jgi:hypothetical protein
LVGLANARVPRAFVFYYGIDGRVRVNGNRKRKKFIVIPGDGDPCPRCGGPMQVREFEEQLPQPSTYTRWFCCMNKTCKTTLVMPARYKVIR